MSEQLTGNEPPARRRSLRASLNQLRTPRRSGMFGLAEIIALGGSAFILIAVLLSYIYFLAPSRSKLQALDLERSQLQAQLRRSQDVVTVGQDAQLTVEKISGSLVAFEDNQLENRRQGRMDLYAELNQLIRKNGLRNTSGPAYTSLEPIGSTAGTTGSKSASTKWQSVYPGISVTVTVEGSYQNLRRFIGNLEASKQFIIINAIELEKAAETNAGLSEETPSGNVRGSLVSLRLDLATYFQRGQDESS